MFFWSLYTQTIQAEFKTKTCDILVRFSSTFSSIAIDLNSTNDK